MREQAKESEKSNFSQVVHNAGKQVTSDGDIDGCVIKIHILATALFNQSNFSGVYFQFATVAALS